MSPLDLLLAAAVLLFAYFVRGITGFGSRSAAGLPLLLLGLFFGHRVHLSLTDHGMNRALGACRT